MPRPKSPLARLLALLIALIAAVGVTVAITDNGPNHGPGKPRGTITVHLGGALEARAGSPTALRVPATAVARAGAADGAHGHAADARDETPSKVPAATLETGRRYQERNAESSFLPNVSPLAAPSQTGCRSRFISAFSSRRGVAPRLIVLHYTVSPNVRGWSDVDGVTGYFARPSTQASSNYVIDGEGNCNLIVSEADKAWAQAAANPFSISIEVINTGRERTYIAPAGLKVLGRVVHDAAARWKIPLRAGAVRGCAPTSAGVVTHHMLGLCGGGHVDVTPFNEQTVVSQVVLAARSFDAPAKKPVTSVDRATCRKLNWWRTHGRPKGKAEANAVRRRKALDGRHVTCTASGPVRR